MSIITQEMKDLLATRQCIVATASKSGVPNAGPKGSVVVVDDSTLAFAELANKKTAANLRENPKACIVVVDFQNHKGFSFVGNVTLEQSGPIYDQFAKQLEAMKMPSPVFVAKVAVEAIYDLGSANPGEKIG